MPTGDHVHQLALRACNCTFEVRCEREETAALVSSVFDALAIPNATYPVRKYNIEGFAPRGVFRVSVGTEVVSFDDPDSLLFHIDKDITLTLQRERRDLFFLHAAAVAWEGRVAVLPAFAGTGKSTLTLASLVCGFEYLSDELAPIDLRQITVEPYPHALCLKSPPPTPYSLPVGTLKLDGRLHVPVGQLPTPSGREPLPVAAVVFLQREAVNRLQGLRSITPASAAARLMAHALNARAHPGYGLDSAIALSQAVPSFELDVTDLAAASRAIKSVLS
jgi:hypothetical protein